MQYSKADVYNLALGALLLTKRVSDPDTDSSNEARVLNSHWKTAFDMTLADLNLDGTSDQVDLELLANDPNDLWCYAYKYPTKCVRLRRLQSTQVSDNRSSKLDYQVRVYGGKKAIFTNETSAIAEFISEDCPIDILSSPAAMCVALRLAILASALITGKGASALRKELEGRYVMTKAEAKALDRDENARFEDDETISEFVEARTEPS